MLSVDILFRAKLLLVLVLATTLVHVGNVFVDGQWVQYGIIPRAVDHLWYIYTAPFIHLDWGHLFNNLIGLTIFSAVCLLRSVSLFVVSSFFILTMTGLLIWLFARDALHVGASGWIFGLWSFSIALAWFDRRLLNILVSLFVMFFYGGMIYGLLPSDPTVSFEGHIFGCLSGVVFAFLYSFFLRVRAKRVADSSSLNQGPFHV